MLSLTYAGEVFGELTLVALIGQLWALPFMVFIYVVDINSINEWLARVIMTALLSYPSGLCRPASPFCVSPTFNSRPNTLVLYSPSHLSWLEQSKLEYDPHSHGVCCDLQHVNNHILGAYSLITNCFMSYELRELLKRQVSGVFLLCNS
jgi:hypothetical protein